MKGNKSVNKYASTYGVKSITALSSLLIIGALCGGCASKQDDEALLKTQNNVEEIDHRIAAIEGRVQDLGQEVQASQSRVYDVYYRSGKKTGMVARPINQDGTPAPAGSTSPVPPVAYASPMSNTPAPVLPKATTAKPVPKPVASVAPAPIPSKPAITPEVLAQGAAPGQKVSPKAPLGALDPSSKMAMKQNGENPASANPAVQELSLPPETAMYVPSASGQAQPLVATAPTTAPVPAQPIQPVQQAQSVQPVQPMQAVAPAMAPVPAQPVQKPAPRPTNEKAAYKAALDLVRSGQATAGRAQFEAFLQRYPQSSLAANAYYWIGESYYSQANYPNALYAFKQVTTQYPKHHKTSDALLKAGLTYQKMGDTANAQMQYRALLADFPNSSAAKIVRNRKL